MNQQDRSEVREMIATTLEGWHTETVIREITTNKSLDNIDKHLENLNGKVASHEKIINVNLPHTSAHCAQTATIQKIHDNMITSKAVRNAIIIGIASTGTLISIAFILYKVFIEQLPL